MSDSPDPGARPTDEEVFHRDGFRCVYCDFDAHNFDSWTFLQVDHFVPKSLGGTNDLDNLKTACIICNQMKGAKTWPSVAEARAEIATWREQMRSYWQENVEPHLSKT